MTEYTVPAPLVVTVDSRRRVALGKLGRPEHTHYLAETDPYSGVITLRPVAIVPVAELEELESEVLERRLAASPEVAKQITDFLDDPSSGVKLERREKGTPQ